MYGQDTDHVAKKPRPRRRLGLLIGLLIVAVLAALFAWEVSRRPKTYHQVGAYPLLRDMGGISASEMLLGIGITPCRTGFCVREKAFDFTLHDWVTGKPRWQVSTAVPYADPKKSKIAWIDDYHAAVSPDGHIFTAACAADTRLRVQTWQDGKPREDIAIELPPVTRGARGRVYELRTNITDDGRCFVILVLAEGARIVTHVVVVEGNRVIAQYTGKYTPQFLPDGQTAIYRGKPVKVAITGKTLHFTNPVKAPTAIPKGFISHSVTTDGRYALLRKDLVLRAVDQLTGAYWEITVPGKNDGGDATMDGRHILASFLTLPDSLTGKVRSAIGAESHFIVLYERPGRPRAWMCVDHLQATSWWPSPDGRSVAFSTKDHCLLYRW